MKKAVAKVILKYENRICRMKEKISYYPKDSVSYQILTLNIAVTELKISIIKALFFIQQ